MPRGLHWPKWPVFIYDPAYVRIRHLLEPVRPSYCLMAVWSHEHCLRSAVSHPSSRHSRVSQPGRCRNRRAACLRHVHRHEHRHVYRHIAAVGAAATAANACEMSPKINSRQIYRARAMTQHVTRRRGQLPPQCCQNNDTKLLDPQHRGCGA